MPVGKETQKGGGGKEDAKVCIVPKGEKTVGYTDR